MTTTSFNKDRGFKNLEINIYLGCLHYQNPTNLRVRTNKKMFNILFIDRSKKCPNTKMTTDVANIINYIPEKFQAYLSRDTEVSQSNTDHTFSHLFGSRKPDMCLSRGYYQHIPSKMSSDPWRAYVNRCTNQLYSIYYIRST